MKTKALLISTLCLLGANYSWAADEDVTPGHLKFADQAVGSYEFVHYFFAGSQSCFTLSYREVERGGYCRVDRRSS